MKGTYMKLRMLKLQSQKGITFVEMLVVMALLGIVLALGYNIYSYATNTYKIEEDRSNVQQDVRLIADFITGMMRTATSVEIKATDDGSYENNKSYIIIGSNAITYKEGTNPPVNVLGTLKDSATYTNSIFRKGVNNVLSYRIEAVIDGQLYYLDSEVTCLNIENIDGAETGTVICFNSLPGANEIISFGFDKKDETKNTNLTYPVWRNPSETGDTITLRVPAGTDLKPKMVATFTTSPNAKVYIGDVEQQSGVTANSFEHSTENDDMDNHIVYRVVAENGAERKYTVNFVLVQSPPSASNLRMIFDNSRVPFKPSASAMVYHSTLITADYTYNSENNGIESGSEIRWMVADPSPTGALSFSELLDRSGKPIVGRSIRPKDLGIDVGKHVKYKVRVRGESGLTSDWTECPYSREIMKDPDGNIFWWDMVNDLYYISHTTDSNGNRLSDEEIIARGFDPDYLPKVKLRGGFNVISNMSPETDKLNLTLAAETQNANTGALISQDIKDYVSDTDSYTVTVDAQVVSGKGGWGILLNGNLSGINNLDNGYLFQFDPGANGFVVRKIDNGVHSNLNNMGVKFDSATPNRKSIRGNTGSNAIYSPIHLFNSNFYPNNTWGDDVDDNVNWYNRYKTQITTQVQLDGSMIFRVKILDFFDRRGNVLDSPKISNEMWFGDFGTITHNSAIFDGINPASHANGDYPIYSKGTYIGLRAWDRTSGAYNTKFQELSLSEGFRMNVVKAEYVSNKRIKVKFDNTLRNFTDRNRIQIGLRVSNAYITNDPVDGQVLMIDLVNPQSSEFLKVGSPGVLDIERGAVKHEFAGDVKIENGMDCNVLKDTTPPTVEDLEYVSRNGLRVTFNEDVDEDTLLNTRNYTLSGSAIQNGTKVNGVTKVSNNQAIITLSKDLDTSWIKKATVTVSNVTDIAGNVVDPANDSASCNV